MSEYLVLDGEDDMRHARKTDGNQAEIVAALRACGASVEVISDVGRGVPDLLVGVMGRNLLAEVKDGRLPPSRRKLTPDEAAWHAKWRGQVCILYGIADVAALMASLR